MSKVFALVVFCLGLAVGINSYAADARPCSGDVAKFCKDVKPGGGRIMNCLKDHVKDLSPVCSERVKKMKTRAKEVHKACADDIDRFCKDVQPGRGNIARCLRKHKAELTPACRIEIGQMNNLN